MEMHRKPRVFFSWQRNDRPSMVGLENLKLGCSHVAHCLGIQVDHSYSKKDKIVIWRKPIQGWFKIGRSFIGPVVGCGGLIRNHNGKVVYAFAGPLSALSAIMVHLINPCWLFIGMMDYCLTNVIMLFEQYGAFEPLKVL
ncbi:hypothetical protein KFK09_023793 [Dendrobium nobile]|uniref:Uncharacterized protein n=1 Tax=Dendrobium nobile TaxID=94219 RepID=A0A8T3AD12_DENNO|nr:hypothetical protein KFK09_023793 [Dendrobium nobile]